MIKTTQGGNKKEILRIGWYKYITKAATPVEAAYHGTQFCYPAGSMYFNGETCEYWRKGELVYTSVPSYCVHIFEHEWLKEVNE